MIKQVTCRLTFLFLDYVNTDAMNIYLWPKTVKCSHNVYFITDFGKIIMFNLYYFLYNSSITLK